MGYPVAYRTSEARTNRQASSQGSVVGPDYVKSGIRKSLPVVNRLRVANDNFARVPVKWLPWKWVADRLEGRLLGRAIPFLGDALLVADALRAAIGAIEDAAFAEAGDPVVRIHGAVGGFPDCGSGSVADWVTAYRFPDIVGSVNCGLGDPFFGGNGMPRQVKGSPQWDDWPAGGSASPSENPARFGVDVTKIALFKLHPEFDLDALGYPAGEYVWSEFIRAWDWDGVTPLDEVFAGVVQPVVDLGPSANLLPWPAINPGQWPIGQPVPTPRPIPYRVLPLLPIDPWQPLSVQHQAGYELGPVVDPDADAAFNVSTGQAMSPEHVLRPPGRGVKEKKHALTTAGAAVRGLFDFLTEANDFLNALYYAVPGRRLSPSFVKGAGGKWKKLQPSMQDKARFVYKHLNQMDMEQALINLARNEAIDWTFGTIGKFQRKAVQHVYRTGYGRPSTTLIVTRRAGQWGISIPPQKKKEKK